MQNLVGQTVRFSLKDKDAPGHKVRTVFIEFEFFDDKSRKRMYSCRDTVNVEAFHADANVYDNYFLRTRAAILPKNTKDKVYNTSNPEYKK